MQKVRKCEIHQNFMKIEWELLMFGENHISSELSWKFSEIYKISQKSRKFKSFWNFWIFMIFCKFWKNIMKIHSWIYFRNYHFKDHTLMTVICSQQLEPISPWWLPVQPVSCYSPDTYEWDVPHSHRDCTSMCLAIMRR